MIQSIYIVLSSGVQNLLSCLEQINVKVGGSDLDLLFLKNLLCSEDVRALLRVSFPFFIIVAIIVHMGRQMFLNLNLLFK